MDSVRDEESLCAINDAINPAADETSHQVASVPEKDQLAISAGMSTLLSACGGGGGSSVAENPAPIAPPPGSAITDREAARFLHQAALAATDADIARVITLGYSAWLDEQFSLPHTQSHYDWMISRGYQGNPNNANNFQGVDNTLWRKLMSSPDILRQRVVLALSEIFVVSMVGLPVSWRGFCVAAYVDLLEENAFGTYRSLLNAITLSTGMGNYLNMRGSQKEDPRTGREPDENYAREVLQLFSLGLYQLNIDGTVKTDAPGTPLETYTQNMITGLAKVFTGWDYTQFNRDDPAFQRLPMSLNASRHSSSDKSFLDITISGGTPGEQALQTALDTIAGHPNVGPFIGRQLIQRLVTSNPSPAYVGRVAAVFNNNGQGVRGDLKAVIKAVLLDGEARTDPAAQPAGWGKLREPVLRFVQWARTFGVTSPTDVWNIGDTSDPSRRLGQSPLRSPSVFNFFRPGYVPPNTSLGAQGLAAPEFQITNESSVVAYANYMQTAIQNGVGEVKGTYGVWLAQANDTPTLVSRIALLMSAGQLSTSTLSTISTAVAGIPANSDASRLNRIYAAILLVMAAPEYIVQK